MENKNLYSIVEDGDSVVIEWGLNLNRGEDEDSGCAEMAILYNALELESKYGITERERPGISELIYEIGANDVQLNHLDRWELKIESVRDLLDQVFDHYIREVGDSIILEPLLESENIERVKSLAVLAQAFDKLPKKEYPTPKNGLLPLD